MRLLLRTITTFCMYLYVFFSDESDSDVICGDSLLFSGLNILSLEDFKALVVCEHFKSGQLFHPSSQKILVHKESTGLIPLAYI